MGALTKSEMAERLYEELGLNKREAKEIVELFFEEIRSCLEANEQVKLSGFGNFDLRDKSQRPGRNPKTGEEIPISARRVVTFRPGQKLKARVEAYGDAMAARQQARGSEDEDNAAGSSRLSGADIGFGLRALDGGTE
jgi:integration host factor subunit alpha